MDKGVRTMQQNPGGRRGRPPQYDRPLAVDAALAVFWRKGFRATSIEDIQAATGMGPASLYGAFGDKGRLYLQCVDRYLAARGRIVGHILDRAPTARRATEDLLNWALRLLAVEEASLLQRLVAPYRLADGPDGPEGAAAVSALAGQAGTLLAARLERGAAAGELPPGEDIRVLACFFSSILDQLVELSRGGASAATLCGAVSLALRAWPAQDPVTG
ncbi:MAG TPA: TetR/AcrR family transcriptional regulator [Azospirillaceae bacterium]|nr:TetR/AcrR family transcriptional regulator [Azospirillaceae bacterium]